MRVCVHASVINGEQEKGTPRILFMPPLLETGSGKFRAQVRAPAEVSRGTKVPVQKKVLLYISDGRCTLESPPSTSPCLSPRQKIRTQVLPNSRISFEQENNSVFGVRYCSFMFVYVRLCSIRICSISKQFRILFLNEHKRT